MVKQQTTLIIVRVFFNRQLKIENLAVALSLVSLQAMNSMKQQFVKSLLMFIVCHHKLPAQSAQELIIFTTIMVHQRWKAVLLLHLKYIQFQYPHQQQKILMPLCVQNQLNRVYALSLVQVTLMFSVLLFHLQMFVTTTLRMIHNAIYKLMIQEDIIYPLSILLKNLQIAQQVLILMMVMINIVMFLIHLVFIK